MKTSDKIRKSFLDYFKNKDHRIIESSPLVPQNDPTLLFTNAGMVPFKSVFLGEEKRDYSRAASSQKCMRAGGKHNDLENVGKTARHHTFFEMLGNFSFGDYFKQDAILMAWEFITDVLNLPPEKLWVTVYEDDDQALDIWNKNAKYLNGKIVRMGAKDNFWSMGDTGPCGPCSEIIFDQGESFGCIGPECKVGCDCDRFLEIWNLVFMQFNRDKAGVLHPLPKPSIDTGMGLERAVAVSAGAKSNYDTDLFMPIISFVEHRSGKTYHSSDNTATSMRVLADHSRAIAFLIADGVLPSNEGRGYVLRRIIRRAIRHGMLLEIRGGFLSEIVLAAAQQMNHIYPELERTKETMIRFAENEEQSFASTLKAAIGVLEEEIETLKDNNAKLIPGETVFKLYDTYGLPVDTTMDIAGEFGLKVDVDGFNSAMNSQRKRAKQAWKGSGENAVANIYKEMAASGIKVEFTGYESRKTRSTVAGIIKQGVSVDSASFAEEEVEVVTFKTPFYGESGGQTGDTGIISGEGFLLEVFDTKKPLPDITVHRARVKEGVVKKEAEALLEVDFERRNSTQCNHTATHILHTVLRNYLGEHVKQAGSMVSSQRLRFDFTHFEALKREDIIKIEQRVNRFIFANTPVKTEFSDIKNAIDMGATALFGEKYSDQVRVVKIADYSMELCGGTHVAQTGDIGLLKIVSEQAVASGVRRIDAVTGMEALMFVQKNESMLDDISMLLKTEPDRLLSRIEKLLQTQKDMEKEIDRLKSKNLTKQADSVLNSIKEISGVKVLVAKAELEDAKALRSYGDSIRDKLGSGIIFFGTADNEKASLLCMVTKDLSKRLSAKAIIEQTAPFIGGKGGGRDDMAQAGGKNPEKLEDALNRATEVIEKSIRSSA